MKSLFDFGDEIIKDDSILSDKNTVNMTENIAKDNNQASIESNFKNLFEQYKGFSKEDLINEFLKVTKDQKESGQLTNEKISNIYNTLMPYLNSQQKDFLKKTLGLIYDK